MFQPYSSVSASIPASGYSHHVANDNCSECYEKTNANQNETMTSNGFHLTNVPSIGASSADTFLGSSNYQAVIFIPYHFPYIFLNLFSANTTDSMICYNDSGPLNVFPRYFLGDFVICGILNY